MDVPAKDLSVEQVERLWKQDRKTIIVMDACGARALAWYDSLAKRWR